MDLINDDLVGEIYVVELSGMRELRKVKYSIKEISSIPILSRVVLQRLNKTKKPLDTIIISNLDAIETYLREPTEVETVLYGAKSPGRVIEWLKG